MPKTSHQHFSVALLSKVNDKNWPETKIWKTSCVTFFQYILAKKTNRILITIYDLLWSWCTYPNPNRSKTPLTLFSSLKPSPSFHFCLDKISFSMPWMFCRKIQKKYIEFSTKNKQLLTNPQSKHFTIEPKSLQSPNWISLFLQFNEKFFMIFILKYLVKWQVLKIQKNVTFLKTFFVLLCIFDEYLILPFYPKNTV